MSRSTDLNPTTIQERLTSERIGGDIIAQGLGSMGVLDVGVDGRDVLVTVALPIPSDAFRRRIEQDINGLFDSRDDVRAVTCNFSPTVPDPGERSTMIPGVKNVVAVAGGKGGVGKSTVAVNLAASIAQAGASVGLLDADVYGPNAPTLLGIPETAPHTTGDNRMLPLEGHGVKVISMGMIVEETDPIIWRGPIVTDVIHQLFADVEWGNLDYLIVDLPPGTGDAMLALIEHLPVSGALGVTSPQSVAIDDTRRCINGLLRYDVPVLGICENMTGFACADCGSVTEIFGSDGASTLAQEFDIPVIGNIPLSQEVGTLEQSDVPEPPGLNIPGIGRLQLPRTREEREQRRFVPPVAIRDDGGTLQEPMAKLATRTVARLVEITQYE